MKSRRIDLRMPPQQLIIRLAAVEAGSRVVMNEPMMVHIASFLRLFFGILHIFAAFFGQPIKMGHLLRWDHFVDEFDRH